MVRYFKHSLLLVLAATLANSLCAQDSEKKNSAQKKRAAPPTHRTIPVRLSVDQEEAALKFAKKHHPELAELLEPLRTSSPEGFNRGIRSIHVAVQRLERFKDRQPTRFDAELLSWKTDSKVRLLTAKWAMAPNPKLEKEIRALLRTRQQAKIDRLKIEREKLSERLKQLDDQIGMGTADLEADLAAEWDRLSKRTSVSARNQKRQPKKKGGNDNTAQKNKTKTTKTNP